MTGEDGNDSVHVRRSTVRTVRDFLQADELLEDEYFVLPKKVEKVFTRDCDEGEDPVMTGTKKAGTQRRRGLVLPAERSGDHHGGQQKPEFQRHPRGAHAAL